MKLDKKPKVTCGAIIKRGGKILLTKRNVKPYKNFWCLPGGHVDWGETAEKTIIREVKEETGLNFKPEFFKYYDEVIPKIKWHAISLFFIGKAEGPIKTDKSEVKTFKWFSEKEIRKLKLAFNNKRVLNDYFKLRRKQQNELT